MKITKTELDSLSDSIKKSIAELKTSGERQTHGEIEKAVTSNQKERLSLIKCIRGGLYKNWDDAKIEKQAVQKELGEELGTAGGFLVPTQISNELIELLRAQTVVRKMPGVRTISMETDKLDMGRQDTGVSTSWGGENTTIAEDTTITFGKISLNLRKNVCLYEISRELIADARIGAESLVRTELSEGMALSEDLALLEGTGGTQPLGLYYHPRVNSTDLSGTLDLDNIADAIYAIEANNGMVTGWASHPRLKQTLRTLKDSNGQYLFADGKTILGGDASFSTISGIPFLPTTQVPITLRPGSGESYLVGGQWSNFIIGEKPGIRIESTMTGGDSFTADQVWIKAVRRVDCALRHPETFVVVKGIAA